MRRSYRVEQGFTFELNLSGVSDELRGDEVRGRSDHLHTAGMRLMIGLCTLETGQERVVDVDATPCQETGHVI